MKTKLWMLTLLLCGMAVNIQAQEASQNARLTVAVDKLSYTMKGEKPSELVKVVGAVLDAVADKTTTEQAGYADAVTASVVTALGGVRRFIVIDRLHSDPNQMTDLLIDGTINYMSTTFEYRTVNDKRRHYPEYYAQIGVTINVKDPATGEMIDSRVFDINRTSWTWFKTADSAMKEALEALRKQVKKYYDTIYPFSARIIERGTVKGEKQKELYIDLGAAHGVREGTHFDVYVIGSIGGKETRQQIARLKVKEVKGDEVSLCKVSSGGKELNAALNAKQPLLIVSTD